MKFTAVLVALVLVACACTVSGSAAPFQRRERDPRRVRVRLLVNRPSNEEMFYSRLRRSGQPGAGAGAGVKGRPYIKPQAVQVRKGEYVCGNSICRLQPGQVPKDCVGCQYPIY